MAVCIEQFLLNESRIKSIVTICAYLFLYRCYYS